MPDKESQFMELKSNWRDEYLKAIASFANDKGGELIIGMDDRGNPVGLKNAKRLLEDLPNKIRNKLGIIPSLEIQKIEKTEVVKVIVKPSSVPISYIEAWGRGTIKIMEHCLAQGLPEPDFKEESGVMQITFYKDKWTEDNLRKVGLNNRQVKAVMYVKERGKITNKEYQAICNTSNRTATRDLTQLVSAGVLEQLGTTGKGTAYILTRHKDAKHATKTPQRRHKDAKP